MSALITLGMIGLGVGLASLPATSTLNPGLFQVY